MGEHVKNSLSNRTSASILTLIVSFLLLYCFALGVTYVYVHEKLESYASTILERSNNLISQVKEIDVRQMDFSIYPPCSEQYLHALRKALWPYPLIKDISYVKDGEIVCSALWGQFEFPVSLDVFKNKVNRGSYTWVFDAIIEGNIAADILYTNNFAITVSPFAFRRFWEDADKMDFNAIIGDYTHAHHFFKIGNHVDLLEEQEHGKKHDLTFLMIKRCNFADDICVYAGSSLPFFFYHNAYIIIALIVLSLIIGSLASAIVISRIEKSNSLLFRLENAINNNHLYFVYQPIYRVKDKSIIGIEALLRWTDPKMGSVSPDVFIHLAEINGLIEKIGLYVIKHAIKECADVIRNTNIVLSLNVSFSDISSDIFRQTLINTIKSENIRGGSIMLEITER